jgi:hypothetical protein
LDDHDEEREIDFEISWFLSLAIRGRFQLVFKKLKEIIDLLEKKWIRKTFSNY